MRLAMGFSHAVHILMMVNFRIINSALHSQRFQELVRGSVGNGGTVSNPCATAPGTCTEGVPLDAGTPSVPVANLDAHTDGSLEPGEAYQGVSDRSWWERCQARLHGKDHEAGFSVREWVEVAMKTKQHAPRTLVCMYFFGGERRANDIQAHMQNMSLFHGLSFL